MVAVRVGNQNHVHLAKAGIRSAGDGVAGVIKDTYAGWVFKQKRAILAAKFSGARAKGSDLHVLGLGHKRGCEQGNCEKEWNENIRLHVVSLGVRRK